MEEGKNLVAMRLKHIVLADLHGWDFVTEYKQIPIAEDESDEKRIRKVLKVKERRKERRKLKKIVNLTSNLGASLLDLLTIFLLHFLP